MMKRTFFVNCIINVAMGIAIGTFLQIAVSEGSMAYGIFCIISVIGVMLNILCGSDDSKKWTFLADIGHSIFVTVSYVVYMYCEKFLINYLNFFYNLVIYI